MGRLLTEYPFVLTLLAGTLIGLSAILVRRASPVIGSGFRWLSKLMAVSAILAYGWSFAWSWGVEPGQFFPGVVASPGPYSPRLIAPNQPSRADSLLQGLGALLILMGVSLAAWALSAWARRSLYRWPAWKISARPPYSILRRPLHLGLMVIGLGASLIAGTREAWICTLTWVAMMQVLLELSDWDERGRIPAAADYQRRTPRYLPRLPLRKR